MDKVEQVVRLIRSKGVGVYFITQNPLDVPQTVLGQLGNRVQHALRAFTPADQKAVRAAADTFRPNPKFKTETAITELAVGEALVSTLQPGGVPSMVERARICPPRSRIGAITAEERAAVIGKSPVAGKYDTPIDRESAYERLNGRASTPAEIVPSATSPAPVSPDDPWGLNRRAAPPVPQGIAPTPRAAPPAPDTSLGGLISGVLTGSGGRRQTPAEALTKSIARSVGSQVGTQVSRALVRGILGSLLKK